MVMAVILLLERLKTGPVWRSPFEIWTGFQIPFDNRKQLLLLDIRNPEHSITGHKFICFLYVSGFSGIQYSQESGIQICCDSDHVHAHILMGFKKLGFKYYPKQAASYNDGFHTVLSYFITLN
jgi:hypothetical protein